MLIRFAIIWALLHIGCLIREIMEYRRSKRWGWKWWWNNHLCDLTEFLFVADSVILFLAVIYWIVNGFNFI